MTEDIIINLLKQVVILVVINSVTVHGVKTGIKTLIKKPKEEKLNRFIVIGIIIAFGIISGFIIQNKLIDKLWKILLFGIFISSWTVAGYNIIIKTLTNLIPKLADRFLP